MNATALQPFLTIALPIMFTILIAVWVNNHGINKGFDGLNAAILGIHKRLDDVVGRLDRIEAKLDNHETRIVRIEERTSPIGRR